MSVCIIIRCFTFFYAFLCGHLWRAVILFIHPLQLFMCLLWILLQFMVVFLTVDLPPVEKRKARDSMMRKNQEEENEKSLVEDVEESDEEGKPLIVSQELMGSYGSVVASSPPRNTTLNPNPSPHSPVSPAESSGVFKNFSISRGQWFTWLLLGALPVCSSLLLSSS